MHTTKGTEKKKCRIVYLMALCGQLNIGRKVMKHAGLDGWKKMILGDLLCTKHCSNGFTYYTSTSREQSKGSDQ